MRRFILCLLFISITIPIYADEIGGGNVHSNFPPLGFATNDMAIVRPRLVIVENNGFTNNQDGSITLNYASADSVANSFWSVVNDQTLLTGDKSGSFDLTTTGLGTFGSLKSPYIYPAADSTTAVQIRKADGLTSVVDVDTTNARVGINTTPGASMDLDVAGYIRTGLGLVGSTASGFLRLYGDVGATSGIYLLDTGNVGIGTTGPAVRLHVKDAVGAGELARFESNRGRYWRIYDDTMDCNNGFYINYYSNTQPVDFLRGKFLFTGTGKFGIGTTVPWQNFVVVGDQAISDTSPSLTYRDSSDNSGICDHYDSADTTWGVWQRWIGSDDGVNGFVISPIYRNPVLYGDASGNVGTGYNLIVGGTATIGKYTLPATDGTANQVLKTNGSGTVSWGSAAAGYTNLTEFVDQTNWRLFYSNGSGDITELALGASGTMLTSAGASSAPAFSSNVTLGTTVGTIDMGGATSLEIPNGADPDLSVEGQISYDIDDDWLRGYDGANQIVIGQKDKVICFTVCNPDLLTDAAFVPIWTNRTGATFNITAIYSFSDVDDAHYILKYTTNATYDFTNLTTIEAITISTNGTGVFYNEKATVDIDDTTVETGKTIGFDASADDVDYIHGVIVGYLDGDVN